MQPPNMLASTMTMARIRRAVRRIRQRSMLVQARYRRTLNRSATMLTGDTLFSRRSGLLLPIPTMQGGEIPEYLMIFYRWQIILPPSHRSNSWHTHASCDRSQESELNEGSHCRIVGDRFHSRVCTWFRTIERCSAGRARSSAQRGNLEGRRSAETDEGRVR